MNVGQLKKLLEGVPNDVKVLIPFSHEFDGIFYSPCNVDSGMCKVSTDPDLEPEDIEEMQLLNKPLPEEDAFMLVPCGFAEEDEDGEKHKHLLN